MGVVWLAMLCDLVLAVRGSEEVIYRVIHAGFRTDFSVSCSGMGAISGLAGYLPG